MRYHRGDRVIALFGDSIAQEGEVLGPSSNGPDMYVVHLDLVQDRHYVMAEHELTTTEELFG
jgi:hypothetical protein